MGLYQHLRSVWKQPSKEQKKERLIAWRREPATVKLVNPTRLDRARSLGYKAKSGVIVVRQRVDRGGRRRPDIKGGRRSKHNRQTLVLEKNYRAVAEERTNKKYPNMEVVNSYHVGQDGKHTWYEVILADRALPEVLADKNLIGIVKNKGRATRGITSAARKSRGLYHKGTGSEKTRPSRNAAYLRKARKKPMTNRTRHLRR